MTSGCNKPRGKEKVITWEVACQGWNKKHKVVPGVTQNWPNISKNPSFLIENDQSDDDLAGHLVPVAQWGDRKAQPHTSSQARELPHHKTW